VPTVVPAVETSKSKVELAPPAPARPTVIPSQQEVGRNTALEVLTKARPQRSGYRDPGVTWLCAPCSWLRPEGTLLMRPEVTRTLTCAATACKPRLLRNDLLDEAGASTGLRHAALLTGRGGCELIGLGFPIPHHQARTHLSTWASTTGAASLSASPVTGWLQLTMSPDEQLSTSAVSVCLPCSTPGCASGSMMYTVRWAAALALAVASGGFSST